MPEMTFSVRWPDGRVEDCYSPSLVVHDHLASGATYTVAEFTSRSTTALREASERVRGSQGHACSFAEATAAWIARSAAAYDPAASVEVVRMWPPLPATTATSTATAT